MERNPIPDCTGGWSASGDSVTLKGTVQPRMFLKDGSGRLIMLDMRSEEISWTQNVAQLGRQFNGALYTTWVRPQDEQDPANAARLYCDANDGTGNSLWCPEFDLGEANLCTFHATSHPVTDLNAKRVLLADDWASSAVNCYLPTSADAGSYFDAGSSEWVQSTANTNLFYCGLGVPGATQNQTTVNPGTGSPDVSKQSWVDSWGNDVAFSSESAQSCEYDPGDKACDYGVGEAIDTTRDYDVRVRFDWSAEGRYLNGFSTTLTQGPFSTTLTRTTTPNAWDVPIRGGFPADGRVALLIQLWTSPGDGMSWLSGPNCKYTNGETPWLPPVSDTTYTVKNIRIKDRESGLVRKVKFKTVE